MTSPNDSSNGALLRLFHGLRTGFSKKLKLQHSTKELTEALAERELFFDAPPLTPYLIRAIRRVTPQFHLQTSEGSRRVWELSQNGSCWGEYEALEPLLSSMRPPKRVLDLGPGMGRSVVFLKRKLEWQDSVFDLYDADGPRQKYPLLAPRSNQSFCGDLKALRQILDHNETQGYDIFDAREIDYQIDALPGPYDLIYSFFGIGFHWALADFWAELHSLMHGQTVGIFTVHHNFEPFPELEEMAYSFVPFRRILAKDRPLNLLVLSPDPDRIAALRDAQAEA